MNTAEHELDLYVARLRERLRGCAWPDEQLAGVYVPPERGARFSSRWLRKLRAGDAENPQMQTLKGLDWALSIAENGGTREDRAA